eukprot:12397681-Alexandrium_andersonii.AAC.1
MGNDLLQSRPQATSVRRWAPAALHTHAAIRSRCKRRGPWARCPPVDLVGQLQPDRGHPRRSHVVAARTG